MNAAIPDAELPNDSQEMAVILAGGAHDVLELGCGAGHVTRRLADSGSRITAVEIDPSAAESARRFASDVHVANLEHTALADLVGSARFDRIVLGDVLEHLARPEIVLGALRSHLNDGGYLVASIPNVTHADVRLMLLGGQWRYQNSGLLDSTHLRLFDRRSVLELFDSCRWQIERLERTTKGALQSELAPMASAMAQSEAVMEAAIADVDSSTYQFVVVATPTETAPDNVSRFASPSPDGVDSGAAAVDVSRLQAENEQLRVRLRMMEERLEDAHWSIALRRRHLPRAVARVRSAARRLRPGGGQTPDTPGS